MMRLLIVGTWSSLVALISAYASMLFYAASDPAVQSEKGSPSVIAVKLRRITVPVITDGAVQGYLLAEMVLRVDDDLYKKLPEPRDTFLTDEAFRTLYSFDTPNFKQIKKQDLTGLTSKLSANVNKRLNAALVKDVLIEDINYLTKSEVRAGR